MAEETVADAEALADAEEEHAETIEVLAHLFREWKQRHPEATWRDFWTAVGNGEVEIPG